MKKKAATAGMIKATEEKAVAKKRPGRPRLTPLPEAIKRTGVVSVPKKDSNHVELIYANAAMFRKSIGLFTVFSPKEMCIDFNEAGMNITAKSHLQSSNIRAEFVGHRMHHYYCETPITVWLNQSNINTINSIIDKNYSKVTIIVKKKSAQSSILFIFKNMMNMDEMYEINQIEPRSPDTPAPIDYNPDTHRIKFAMPTSFFKKFMLNIDKISDTLAIEKVWDEDMTFKSTSNDDMVSSTIFTRDAELLNLTADVDEGKTFRASIKLDYVTPLAKALIGTLISVAASETDDMLFSGSLDDESIKVYVGVNIVKFQ